VLWCASGKVHRDLKLENILLSKKEEEIENISIRVSNLDISAPCFLPHSVVDNIIVIVDDNLMIKKSRL